MDTKIFGTRLKMLRQEQGFSQEDIANYLKTRPATSTPKADKSLISKYENGKTDPQKWDTISALATMLRVNPEYLSGVSDSRYSEDRLLCKHIPIISNKAVAEGQVVSVGVECVSTRDDVDMCIVSPDDSLLFAGVKKGGIVFANTKATINNGDIAIIILDNNAPILRRYYNHADVIILRPDDRTAQDTIINKDEHDRVKLIAKAVSCKCVIK